MKKTDFITKMLELGAELEKAETGMKCNMIINDANILYDRFMASEQANGANTSHETALNIDVVSKVKDFICPCCTKLVPITKVIYECECGVKHESQIKDVTAVCGLHEEAADCKHRNNGKCTFTGSCYFQQTDC